MGSWFSEYRFIFKHLAVALAIAILLIWLVFFSLKIFTRHGQSLEVPDFTGLTVSESEQLAKQHGLLIQLTDSTFVGGRKKGTVVSHFPSSGERVKRGRRIFITINAHTIPRISMPNVMGVSYRQAKVTLESSGLRIGNLIYKPDLMRSYVLGQRFGGQDIAPGTMIAIGEKIDLVLGLGNTGETVSVTEVVGMTLIEAQDAINSEYLNIGAVIFDSTIETYSDTLHARVYKQSPIRGREARVGSFVDLWLTLNIEQYVETQ